LSEVRDLIEAPDLAIDRPWLAIDRSQGPRHGWLYVTTRGTPPSGATAHAHLKVSPDAGTTWSGDIIVDDSPYPSLQDGFSYPAVGPDGTLYVAYASSGSSSNDPPCPVACVAMARSNDGAGSFSRYFVTLAPAPGSMGYTFDYALAANPSHSGAVAFTWNGRGDNPSDVSDVFLVHSVDDGVTWSPPVRVNDDPVNQGVGHDFPTIAYAPTGTLCVEWRDRRPVSGDITTPFKVYFACSDDDGTTFTMSNQSLSDKTSPSPPPPDPAYNDFIGVAVAGPLIYGAWGDYRTNDWEVFYGAAKVRP
jgi:hypothetical protein